MVLVLELDMVFCVFWFCLSSLGDIGFSRMTFGRTLDEDNGNEACEALKFVPLSKFFTLTRFFAIPVSAFLVVFSTLLAVVSVLGLTAALTLVAVVGEVDDFVLLLATAGLVVALVILVFVALVVVGIVLVVFPTVGVGTTLVGVDVVIDSGDAFDVALLTAYMIFFDLKFIFSVLFTMTLMSLQVGFVFDCGCLCLSSSCKEDSEDEENCW
jgi:hypothetical protein